MSFIHIPQGRRLALMSALVLLAVTPAVASAAPYPSSTAITGITVDWTSHHELAPGSDNWATTWAADSNLYTTWGDGGGFGDGSGRAGIGVSRVQGTATSYSGFNVFAGLNPEGTSTFTGYDDPNGYYRGVYSGVTRANGKSYAILSVNGRLYMWLSPRSGADGYIETRLAWSSDNAKTWHLEEWGMPGLSGPNPRVVQSGAIQFGQNYAGVPSYAAGYVYLTFIGLKNSTALTVQQPGEIYLARVPANDADIRNPASYQWYSSTTTTPAWSSTAANRKPVFTDAAGGVGWNSSMQYDSALGRYILITEHTATSQGNLGMFESTRPWGPWKTITYQSHWHGTPSATPGTNAFYWNIPTKWIQSDGKHLALVFSGVTTDDSWNTVQATLQTP